MKYMLLALFVGFLSNPLNAQNGGISKAEEISMSASFEDYAKLKGGMTQDIVSTSSWKRTVYRTVSKDKLMNSLFFNPVESGDKEVNLFSLLINVAGEQNDVPVYKFQYTENDKNPLQPTHISAILKQHSIPYTTKGSTNISVSNSDLPTNRVSTYHIKEVWYFDTKTNRGGVKVDAICPVLDVVKAEDRSTGKVTKVPMCWIPFDCIAPYLLNTTVYLTDEMKAKCNNSIKDQTMFEYIANRHYSGEIYQVDNSILAEHYKAGESLAELQNTVEAWLSAVENNFKRFK